MARRPGLLFTACVFLLISLRPDVAQAGWDEGTQALRQGRYEEAAQEFRAVTRAQPDYVGGHYMLGVALDKLQRPSEALTSLRKATELAPDNARYSLTLAQVLVRTRRPQEALEGLARHDLGSLPKEIQKDYVQSFAAAGERTDSSAALPILRQGARQLPSSASLWQTLGRAAQLEGRTGEAFDAYARGFETAPTRTSLGLKAMSTALKLAEETSDPQSRKEWFRKAAEMGASASADSDPAHRLLPGQAWLNADETTKAESWFRQLLRERPQDPAAEHGLARALLQGDKPEEALEALDRALAASPDADLKKKIHRRRGSVLHGLERYADAAGAYRLASDPEKAAEMENFQKIADDNKSIDQRRKECSERQRDIARRKAEGEKIFPPDEWAVMAAELDRTLVDCLPFLEDRG